MKRLLPHSAPILLLFLPFIFFWKHFLLNGDQQPYFGNDALLSYYTLSSIKQQIEQGFIPLWDPYTFFGIPLLSRADSLVFYPPLGLLVIIGSYFHLSGESFFQAMEFLTVAHLSLAGLGMYAFLRKAFGIESWAACIGALAYQFNANMIAHMNTTGLLMSMALLPITFLSFHNLITLPNRRTVGIFSLLFSAPFTLFVWQNGVVYVGVLFGVYLLWHTWGDRKRFLRASTAALLGAVVAIGLSSMVVLPGLQVPKVSSRADLTYELSSFSGNHRLRQAFDLIIPYASMANLGERATPQLYAETLPYAYIGIPSMLIIFFAFMRTRKGLLLWTSIAITSFAFSFGGETPVFDAAYILLNPLIAPFRNVTKVLYLTFFSLSILIAFGVENIWNQSTREKVEGEFKKIRHFLGLILGSCVAYAFFLNQQLWQEVPGERSIAIFSTLNSLSLFLLFLIGIVLVITIRLHHSNQNKSRVALILLISVELYIFASHFPINYYGHNPEQLVGENAITNTLKEKGSDPFSRVDIRTLPQNYAPGLTHLRHIDGYLVYRSKIVSEFYQLMTGQPRNLLVDAIGHVESVAAFPGNIPGEENPNDPFTYTVVKADNYGRMFTRGNTPSGWQELAHGSPTTLAHYKNLIPYATFTEVLFPINDSDAKDILKQQKLRFPQQILLMSDRENQKPRTFDTSGAKVISSQELNPYTIKIETDAPSEQFLNLSHPFYTEWKATVNGTSQQIQRTNLAFSGIMLPAGQNSIVLKYTPSLFYWGLILSGISLAIVLTAIGIPLRRRYLPSETIHE